MPSHKARASIKRLQRQLEFDHPGVRNLPTKSTKRSPTSPTNRTTNEFTWEKQPYFILGTGHYARILAELQGGAPHVTSYLEEAGKVRNTTGSCKRSSLDGPSYHMMVPRFLRLLQCSMATPV